MYVVPRIMRQPEALLDPQNAPKSLAGFALDPTRELTALPQTPWLDLRGPTSNRRGSFIVWLAVPENQTLEPEFASIGQPDVK